VLISEKMYLLKFAGIKPEVFRALCKTAEAQAAFAPTVTAVFCALCKTTEAQAAFAPTVTAVKL
jgi:hypothetical protein